MTKEQQRPAKQAKPRRNEPCWCGSGRKYKDCHLRIEEEQRTEQLRLRHAQDSLLPKIIEAAESVPHAFPAAFERFWEGRYSIDQMGELDELEDRGAERFLTWFAFDYRQDDGQTLVEQLSQAADEGGFAVEPPERRLLDQWRGVRLRGYGVETITKGKGLLVRDLLSDQRYDIADYGASKRLEEGEVVVGHLVPADTAPGADAPTYYVAGAAAHLTEDTSEKFVEFASLYLADLRRNQPDATWDDLIRERSEVLNHFVIALPREERDPGMLDRIILEGRVSLQLTSEAVANLLGRNKPDDEGDKEEEGEPEVQNAEPALLTTAEEDATDDENTADEPGAQNAEPALLTTADGEDTERVEERRESTN